MVREQLSCHIRKALLIRFCVIIHSCVMIMLLIRLCAILILSALSKLRSSETRRVHSNIKKTSIGTRSQKV